MKKLENKTTEIVDGKTNLKYSDLAVICMGNVPQGATYLEMEKNLDLVKKLRLSNGEINLEEAEHALLVDKVANFKWAMQHDDIVAFSKAIINA